MVLVRKLSALESSESLSPDTSIDTFGESRTFSGQFSVAVGLKKKFSIQKCQQRHLLEFIRLHFQKDALGVAICVRLFVRRLVWLFTKVAFPLQLDGSLSFSGSFKRSAQSFWCLEFSSWNFQVEAIELEATYSKRLIWKLLGWKLPSQSHWIKVTELETTESKSRTPEKCAQFFN